VKIFTPEERETIRPHFANRKPDCGNCQKDDCQECCQHDDRDHGICIDCDHDNSEDGSDYDGD
jgi:hypothetical protein